jgi:hypothetical protein
MDESASNMDRETLEVILQVDWPKADENQIDDATRQLLSEIRQLDVFSAELLKAGPAPEGSMAVDPVIVGMLIVAIGPTLLTKLLDFLHAWAMRREGRTIKIKIQTPDGAIVEVEFPQTVSFDDVEQWIAKVEAAVIKQSKNKQRR